MQSDDDVYAALVTWLEERGHSAAEIERILAYCRQYDAQMSADSIMDSLGSGTLDLDRIIQEALGSEDAS